MNKYELTIVVSASIEEEQRNAIVEKVQEYITRYDGRISGIDEAGLKDLAYPIEKMSQGYYYFFTIDTDNKEIAHDLERKLRIMDEVIRFMCVAVEA
ncbi:MAG: 30S ribosomal protein S6 [Eubacterium sp.]|nr:30S ribosomal protein S6 [Eubacterium sp.]